MRMTSVLVIAIGVLFVIIAVNNTIPEVIDTFRGIGHGSNPPIGNPNAPSGCLAPSGKIIPCISSSSVNQIQQNMVNL